MPSSQTVQTAAFAECEIGTEYSLECRTCGDRFHDDGVRLQCLNATSHGPSLLTTRYAESRFVVKTHEPGVFRYRAWLPQKKEVLGLGRTVTYRSDALTKLTGAGEVWVAFHGYWPERHANLETCSFKDLEACTTLARLPANAQIVLVVASAGNTASAFARSCSINGQRCVIVIPEAALPAMRFAGRLSNEVKIVCLSSPADYSDAIELANRLAAQPRFCREGGVFNVARRDGLGTLLLNAAETIGRLPDYYFQAVGSGSGAIAVHETAERLVRDGRYGQKVPRQILSQNLPFAPMYSRWKAGKRTWITLDENESRRKISQMAASVLSNRNPPYSLPGGVFDVLRATSGGMIGIDNEEAQAAAGVFKELENIDIEPASAVSVASLLNAAQQHLFSRSATVLINITGGGRKRREGMEPLPEVRPDLTIGPADIGSEVLMESVWRMFF